MNLELKSLTYNIQIYCVTIAIALLKYCVDAGYGFANSLANPACSIWDRNIVNVKISHTSLFNDMILLFHPLIFEVITFRRQSDMVTNKIQTEWNIVHTDGDIIYKWSTHIKQQAKLSSQFLKRS